LTVEGRPHTPPNNSNTPNASCASSSPRTDVDAATLE
jgi:hypothetical protein